MAAVISSGMVLRLVPRTTYNFGGLAASGSIELPVAQHVDVSPFQEVDLVVRTHTATAYPGTIDVIAYLDGWSPEDPATTFQSTYIGVAGIVTGTAYGVTTLTGVYGRLLLITVKGTMSGTVDPLTATLSIDLVMKGGDPSGIRPAYNTYRGYR